MNKTKLLISAGAVIFLGGSLVIAYSIRRQYIYNNTVTVQQAIDDMRNPNKWFINTNNAPIQQTQTEVIENEDTYQYSNGADDIEK